MNLQENIVRIKQVMNISESNINPSIKRRLNLSHENIWNLLKKSVLSRYIHIKDKDEAISKAIAAADAGSLVKEIRANTSAVISYGDKTADLSIDDLVVTETPKEGWAVASHSGESVALDLELTPDLIAQGLVREVIRAVQEARKQADFDISDRINISMGANPDVIAAVKSNQELVASETLALAINYLSETDTSNELGLKLEVTKA